MWYLILHIFSYNKTGIANIFKSSKEMCIWIHLNIFSLIHTNGRPHQWSRLGTFQSSKSYNCEILCTKYLISFAFVNIKCEKNLFHSTENCSAENCCADAHANTVKKFGTTKDWVSFSGVILITEKPAAHHISVETSWRHTIQPLELFWSLSDHQLTCINPFWCFL